MTTFYCDLRVSRQTDDHYYTISVEVPAPDLPAAVQMLLAFKAGMAVHGNFGHASEESLYSMRRRMAEYWTLREAAQKLSIFLT